MTTNQEGVHAAVRAVTGTSRSYNEDWHALFDNEGIAAGPFNARMLAWINATLGTSYTNVNEAMQAFAVDQGFTNWSSMNTFVAGVPMHTDGMLFEYRFAEGSGTTVADSMAGTYPINLDLPTTPNYTWTSKGVSLASGLIQTPSIPGLRTVAFLYRVGRGDTSGFTLSGGASSGAGWLGSGIPTDVAEPGARVYFNGALRQIRRRTDNGQAGNILNRNGYVLAFRRFSTAYTTALGFGGRHSTTTSRCASFEVVWAGGWNDVLTDAEMIQVGDSLRPIAKARGVYIHKADCPAQADCALLLGQSNADGRALLTDLALAERTYAATKTYIEAANSGTRATPPPALLVMGTNQIITSPSTQFGPEYGLAKRRDASGLSRDLYLSKTAAGSTFIAPSSVGAPVTGSTTWAPGEIATTSLLHFALTDWYDMEQRMMLDGIGPNLRALFWMQGEQDATTTVAAPDSTTHQGYIQAMVDDVRTYTGEASLPVIVGRIRQEDPGMNATAKAAVRAGQAAFVSANSGCVLIDTDGYALAADNVHYNGAGQSSLGQAFYDAITWE